MFATKTIEQEQVCGVDDPIFLLRNEQISLLGQLWLLEHSESTHETITEILQALMRDSQVHFKREALLLHALEVKIGDGGRSFRCLTQEHEILKKLARQLLKKKVAKDVAILEKSFPPHQVRQLTIRFRAHIHHVETVVYLLVQTRLPALHQKQIAWKILSV